MVGTFADVVVADAIVKNVKGFDLDTARDAILKDVSCTLYSVLSSYSFYVVVMVYG